MPSLNLDSANPKAKLTLPVGTIGFAPISTDLVPTATRLRELVDGDNWGFPPLFDSDFLLAFTQKIPEVDEQAKYVRNTASFLQGNGKNYDPHYVLFFRRTLPAEVNKPEEYWTSDYIIVRNGLREEIPGEYRLHTVILCSTLQTLLDVGLANSHAAGSDGEIQIKPTEFDQNTCLFSFRQADQQQQLDAYEKTQSATSLPEFLARLKELKTEK